MKKYILPFLFFYGIIFSQEFYHDTQGKLDVSASGQATYTLPIALPPSIQDVGPTINLTYNSGQSGGIGGQGWSISSISSIIRISARRDIDGFVDGVDFDENDKLSLDGQRLLVVPGTGNYWSDGSIYQTEIQSNVKVELKGSGASIYFIVTNPDGSRSWYGNYGGMNATDLTAYYITRYEDINGNFILYSYNLTSDNNVSPIVSANSITIDEINFSANINGNSTPINKIKFYYKLIGKYEWAYLKGQEIRKIDLLYKIEVKTNNTLFRRYELTHKRDAIYGYDRVETIQEFNGNGEPANPVELKYWTTLPGIALNYYTNSFISDDVNLNNGIRLTGDFTGDGVMDLVLPHDIYYRTETGSFPYTTKALPFNVNPRRTLTGTILNDNKLLQCQSLIHFNETSSNLQMKMWSYFSRNVSTYEKNFAFDNSPPVYDPSLNVVLYQYANVPPKACEDPTERLSNQYFEGDFNGDGISEVLVYRTINERYYRIATNYIHDGQVSTRCEIGYDTDGVECFLLDTNPASSTTLGEKGYSQIANSILLHGFKKYVNDFNGDGKSDVLVINTDGNYKIIGFKELTSAPWVEIELLGQGNLDSYDIFKQILFGDYNGDGKIDIMLPAVSGYGCEGSQECARWYIYYGKPVENGFEFSTKRLHSITDYLPVKEYPSGRDYHNDYYAIDVNKDGKTDLVRFETEREPGSNGTVESWRVHTFINNIGIVGSIYTWIADFRSDFKATTLGSFHFLGPARLRGSASDLLVLEQNQLESNPYQFRKVIWSYQFTKDFMIDNSITKITQSNGTIVDNIEYGQLIASDTNSGQGLPTEFYSVTNTQLAPNLSVRNSPNMRLVSRLTNISSELGTRKQDFKYHGFIISLDGLGVLGFTKTARSSWYKSISDKQIWNVTENDPLLRGASRRTYTQLIDSGEVFGFVSEPINSQNVPGLLSLTENTYLPPLLDNSKKYILFRNSEKTTDFLTGVTTEKYISATSDGYWLPSNVLISNYKGNLLQGQTTTVTLYSNSTTGSGSTYFIGRPREINTTSSAYGDSQSKKEVYGYNNGNLSRIETSHANDPVTLIESMTYFPNGNLKSKGKSAIGGSTVSPRIMSFTYDSSNRFLKTMTDADGKITINDTFHPLYGMPQSITNQTLSQTSTYIYDNWGKLRKKTDDLGNSINYTYSRLNNVLKTLMQGDDGSESFIEMDIFGRKVREATKDIQGVWRYSGHSIYNHLNLKILEYDPYFSEPGSTPFTTYFYDEYNRLVQTESPSHKITNFTYDGLTATTNDGIITKTSSKDSNGFVIESSDDLGGTTTYTYDAIGNMLTSNYAGTTITMTYDKWGRKETLSDPSAGYYEYTYNPYGEILTEKTPKGTTTYNLDPVGKLLTKHIVGKTSAEKTDILCTYSYDTNYKWLKNVVVVNPNDGDSTYSYEYDELGTGATMKLKTTTEILPYATFTKQLTFDEFGRIQTEKFIGNAHNKTSEKTVFNVYKFGILEQIKENDNSGIVLWKLNKQNAWGESMASQFANGMALVKEWDDYGFPTQIKYSRIATGESIMKSDTYFDPERSNLVYRSSDLFNTFEGFEYDNLDRLTGWENDNFETLHDCKFNSGSEGFISEGGSVLTNLNGRLKINATADYAGASKLITSNAIIGQTLNFSFDIKLINECNPQSNPWNCNNSDLVAVVYEMDPNGTYINEQFHPITSDGITDFQYIVTAFPDVYIKFYIYHNNNPLFTQYTSRLTFSIDDFKVGLGRLNYQSYTSEGKINTNGLGTYNYTNSSKPYWNTTIKPLAAEALSYYNNVGTQSITYNAFKAPISVNQLNEHINFGYNLNEQRSLMFYGSNDTNKLLRPSRKYYSADGTMEIKYNVANDEAEFITYIGGNAYTAPIVIKCNGVDPISNDNTYYLHRDYLGSIVAISNSTSDIVEKRLFDAWGNLVKVEDGVGNLLPKMLFFDRGYTGHEHLQGVSLIHMNARLYDPKLHRMLQSDNFVQNPVNSQDYNRYSYAHNNPLRYIDPDGNEGITVVIAAVVAVACYMLQVHEAHQQITPGGLFDALFWGIASGVVSFGVGEATGTMTSFFKQAAIQSAVHGVTQGGIQSAQGGNFWSGFAAGSLSSLASSAWLTGAGDFARSSVGMISFGTISGGVGASLSGGNFWEGAAIGFAVSACNHYLHSDEPETVEQTKPQNGEIDFYDLFDKVLQNKPGTNLTVDEIIKKYNLPTKLKDAIVSMKVVGKNKVYVNWNNEGSINKVSKINVKDGTLTLRRTFVPTKSNKVGYNGFVVEGDGLSYDPDQLNPFGKVYNPTFVARQGIYGYISKNNTITKDGAKL